jgi:hypothetical protein
MFRFLLTAVLVFFMIACGPKKGDNNSDNKEKLDNKPKTNVNNTPVIKNEQPTKEEETTEEQEPVEEEPVTEVPVHQNNEKLVKALKNVKNTTITLEIFEKSIADISAEDLKNFKENSENLLLFLVKKIDPEGLLPKADLTSKNKDLPQLRNKLVAVILGLKDKISQKDQAAWNIFAKPAQDFLMSKNDNSASKVKLFLAIN